MSGVTRTFQRQVRRIIIDSSVLRFAVGTQRSPANKSDGSAGLYWYLDGPTQPWRKLLVNASGLNGCY